MNSSVGKPKTSTKQPSNMAAGAPTFFVLPRELRDEIYIDLLTSGDFALLHTSHTIYDEASRLLEQHAVLRMTMRRVTGLQFDTAGLTSIGSFMDRIQNFDIQIYFNDLQSSLPLWRRYYRMIEAINPDIEREVMTITLMLGDGSNLRVSSPRNQPHIVKMYPLPSCTSLLII